MTRTHFQHTALCLLALSFTTGCPPKALQLDARTTPTFQTGNFSREIRTLTDLDTVRDIASEGTTVYVATDRGLLVYPEGSRPTRIVDGIGPDVRAVSVSAQGVAIAASATGLFSFRGTEPGAALSEPPVGDVVALHTDLEGTVWACGDLGVARLRSGAGWEGYGEPAQCTGLWPTPEGRLWIGTTRGLWYQDAEDVIREHGESRGIPAGWVVGVVPAQPGQAFVLVQNTSEAYLGWFDGNRWYGYTIPEFEPHVVGLSRRGADAVLVTRQHAYVIQDAARGAGVPLRALSRGDRNRVLSYGARITTGDNPNTSEPLPARGPVRLAAVPPNHPSIEAPGFVASPLTEAGQAVYLVRQVGGTTYVADRNQGVAVLGTGVEGAPEPRRLRSQDLVAQRDLQVVSDERGNTWILTDDGVIGRFRDGILQKMDAPAQAGSPQAIASARRGVYVATRSGNQVSIFRWATDQWELAARRTLFETTGAPEAAPAAPEAEAAAPSGTQLASVPMLGVTDDETFWVAVRVGTEERARPRGVAVFSGAEGPVVYHHHGSNPATDGEGSLQLIDDIGNIDLNESGMAWFSTLNGAVRLGNHQAVVFGEARGVRGEVVSDVLVGGEGRVWVAAAEGPGYYFNRAFEFRMPAAVRAARPIALALDATGHVWGAGPNGLVQYDGSNWSIYGNDSGLPTTELVDIEGDAAGNLWLLGRDQVVLLGPPRRATAPE